MANCQNNMRYGRQNNMYRQRQSCGNNQGNEQRTMPGMDSRYRASDAKSGCGTARMEELRQESDSCGCRRRDELAGMALAMAYVPWQNWREIYDVCKGLQTGTIFGELDKPFLGRGGCNR